MKPAFTLLELIIVLTIISILSLLTVPTLQRMIYYHASYVDMARLYRSIYFTRSQAIYRQQMTQLSPINGHWRHGYIVTIHDRPLAHFQGIRPGAHLIWKNFPNSPYLQFTPEGFTNYQNGTFTYTSADGNLTRKLIINQAGRIRIE